MTPPQDSNDWRRRRTSEWLMYMQMTDISKGYFFLIEKYIEDLRQDEKHVPDLLESIMRPTDPIKEELRQILFKTNTFRPEITKMRVCTFQMSGKNQGFDQRSLRGSNFNPSPPPFCNIWPRWRPNIRKMRVLARRALTLVKKLNFQAVIKSSRLDHGLKGPGAFRRQKCWFLAPSGAKNMHFQN